jgi:hypothetical protein
VPVTAAFSSAYFLIQAKIFASDSASTSEWRPRDFGEFNPFSKAAWTAEREQLKARIKDPIQISVLRSVRDQLAGWKMWWSRNRSSRNSAFCCRAKRLGSPRQFCRMGPHSSASGIAGAAGQRFALEECENNGRRGWDRYRSSPLQKEAYEENQHYIWC